MTLGSRSFPSLHQVILWVVMETSFCCVPLEFSGNTCHVRSSTVLVSNSFVSTKREKRVSQNTISFWIRSVISHVYGSASDEDCRLVKVKAHKDRKIATSLLFRRKCAIQQVLKVGTWSPQSTFSAFYFRDVTHRHMDVSFNISVVEAQKVV